MMPNFAAVPGFSSTLSLTILTLPLSDLGNLFEGGRDHLARAAPLRPEIHHHRFAGLEHVLIERCVGYLSTMEDLVVGVGKCDRNRNL